MTPPILAPSSPDLCWLDVETTGLDPRTGSLLEVGVILTDWSMTEIARASWLLHFNGEVSETIALMHGAAGSGLLADCRQAAHTREAVEAELSAWLRAHHVTKATMLANNSADFDRRWLREHLPTVEAMLSHRNLDLTSLDYAMGRWFDLSLRRDKDVPHRALPDLEMALTRARAYRDHGDAVRRLVTTVPKCQTCGAVTTKWHVTDEGDEPFYRCADCGYDNGVWKGDPVPWDAEAVARLTPLPGEAG